MVQCLSSFQVIHSTNGTSKITECFTLYICKSTKLTFKDALEELQSILAQSAKDLTPEQICEKLSQKYTGWHITYSYDLLPTQYHLEL